MNTLLSESKFGAQKFFAAPKCTGGGSGCSLTTVTTTSETKWWLAPIPPTCKPRDNRETSWRFHRTNIPIPCSHLPGDDVGIPSSEPGRIESQLTRWVSVFKELTCKTGAKMGDRTATPSSVTLGKPCTCKCKTNCGKPSTPTLVTGPDSLNWSWPPSISAGPTIDYEQTGEWEEKEEYKDRVIYWCKSHTRTTDQGGPGANTGNTNTKPASTLNYQVQTKKYTQSRRYAYSSTTTCSCGAS